MSSPRPRQPFAIRLSAVTVVAAAAVTVTGAGVYALLSATAFNTSPQAVGSGTLKLTMNGGAATFASDISNLVPTQSVDRYVTLTNGGTLAGKDLKLGVTDATPSLLTTDATKGLQVTVASCTTPWVGGVCGDLAGASTQLSTSMKALTTSPVAMAGSTMAAGETRHLKVTVTLPDQVEVTENGQLPAGTIQGLAASLTWTFSETQA